MDEYLDQYFSSSSWDHNDPDRQNAMLPNLLEIFKDFKNPSASNLTGNHTMDSLSAQDTSSTVVLNEDLNCSIDKDFLSGEALTQKHGQVSNGNLYTKNLDHPQITEFWVPPVPVTVSDRTQGLGLCGSSSYHGVDAMRNEYQVGMDKVPQFDNFSAEVSSGRKQELQNQYFASFGARPLITTPLGLTTLPQNAAINPACGSNGNGKPRVRARRGQATDPHSIAERLRREKIAERMKNLQELVPNSSKTDKASMLDEIIEYVKFLQLQVKVLSMSRIGAAAAVIPLITNGQTEVTNGLSLSSSTVHLGDNISQNPDQAAFEQEVVRLMELNLTEAMQYLQGKGLCLMPIALATAISNGKPPPSSSSSSAIASDKKKLGSNNSDNNNNNNHSSSSSNSSLLARGMVGNGCDHGIKLEGVNSL